MNYVDKAIETLRQSMPCLCTRDEIERLTGGLVKRRTLANLDSRGEGPRGKVRLGTRVVAYDREAFLLWFAEHLTATDQAEYNPAGEGANHVTA